MPKKRRGRCLTCAHPEKARIELMLANGVKATKVARQFQLSSHSVRRHFEGHVTPEHKAALALTGVSDPKVDLEALKRAESETLLQRLRVEYARLQRIADLCESFRDYEGVTRASAEIRKTLETIGKYLGELKTGSLTVTNNFLLSPDWFQLRAVIAAALRPFPDAQRAVLTAIRNCEHEKGADVTDARAIALPGQEGRA